MKQVQKDSRFLVSSTDWLSSMLMVTQSECSVRSSRKNKLAFVQVTQKILPAQSGSNMHTVRPSFVPWCLESNHLFYIWKLKIGIISEGICYKKYLRKMRVNAIWTWFHFPFAGGAFGDAIGVWKIVFPPQPAGGPFTIDMACFDGQGNMSTSQLQDILFGDVWICSGQSNMAFAVKQV